MAYFRKRSRSRMVRRRRPFRRPRRRSFRRAPRRYKRLSNKVYSPMLRQPVADRLFTTLRYFEQVSYSIPANNTAPLAVRYQTSIFAPGLAGGHQPYWRDQMASLYNRYRVHGVRYKFQLGHNNAVSTPVMWALKESNTSTLSATTVATWNTVNEQNDTRKGMVGAWAVKPAFIKGYMPTGKPWGLTKSQMKQDDQFWAMMSSDPTKMSYIILYMMNPSGITTADTIVGTVELNYLVEMSDRLDATGS